MKQILTIVLIAGIVSSALSQTKPVSLYTLVKAMALDSISDMGEWDLGSPKASPIKWDAENIMMSDDLKINFYRTGVATVLIMGHPYPWKTMIYGPRSGFMSFMITGPVIKEWRGKPNMDSLLGKNAYTLKLLKSCDKQEASGFYFYEIKIPKKKIFWAKLNYSCSTAGCTTRLAHFDAETKQELKLDCPN
jgi:hypothetical protein